MTEVEKIWMGKIRVGPTYIRIRPSNKESRSTFTVTKLNGEKLGEVFKTHSTGIPTYSYYEGDKDTSLRVFSMQMLIKTLHTYYSDERAIKKL